MSSSILVINANPKSQSFGAALSRSYAEAARNAGREVRVVHLGELNFDPNLSEGYDRPQPLEADLEALQRAISEASHLVIVTPVWWGTLPAKFKGVLDRVLLPGFAFRFEKGKPFPRRLLQGKTARVIATMDSPVWYYRFIMGNPLMRMLKRPVLGLCGIKTIGSDYFGPVSGSTEAAREAWLRRVGRSASKDARR